MSDIHGSCLCGAVAWTVTGPVASMTHCHCSRCRKAHGANFATYLLVKEARFRLDRGHAAIRVFTAGTELARPFCRHCGTVVADGSVFKGMVTIPAGPLDDDPGNRPLAHIFSASKAPWHEITDALPQFAAYPPGFADPAALPPREPPGSAADGPRGSCLCDGVRWVMTGRPKWCRNCHCSRCRKQRGAAHASNVVTAADGVRFTAGEDLVVSYKLPSARFFTHTFCSECGSSVPRIDPTRDLAILPMGAFDDDPGVRVQHHIFVGSRAPWFEITDDLPQHTEFPPD